METTQLESNASTESGDPVEPVCHIVPISFIVPHQTGNLEPGEIVYFQATTHNMRVRFLGRSPFKTREFTVDKGDELGLEVVAAQGVFTYLVEMRSAEVDSSFTDPCMCIDDCPERRHS